jgi:hypothetical protein
VRVVAPWWSDAGTVWRRERLCRSTMCNRTEEHAVFLCFSKRNDTCQSKEAEAATFSYSEGLSAPPASPTEATHMGRSKVAASVCLRRPADIFCPRVRLRLGVLPAGRSIFRFAIYFESIESTTFKLYKVVVEV